MRTFENMYGKETLNTAKYETSANIGSEGFTFGNEVKIVEMKLPVYKGYRPSLKRYYFIYGFITDTGKVYVGVSDDKNTAIVYNIKSYYESYKNKGYIKDYVLPLSLDDEKVQKYIEAYKLIEPFTTLYTSGKYPVNIEELEKKELYENIYYIEYETSPGRQQYAKTHKGYIVPISKISTKTGTKCFKVLNKTVCKDWSSEFRYVDIGTTTLEKAIEEKQTRRMESNERFATPNEIITFCEKELEAALIKLTDVEGKTKYFDTEYRTPKGKERIYLVEKYTLRPPSIKKRYEFVIIYPDGKKTIFDSFTLDIAIAGRGNYKYKDGYRIGNLEDIKHHHRNDLVIIKDADGKEVLFERMPGETKTGTCYKGGKLKDGDIRILFDRNKYKELESKYHRIVCKDNTGTYFRKPSTGTEGIFWVHFNVVSFKNGEVIDLQRSEGYMFAYLDPETGERSYTLTGSLDAAIRFRNQRWAKGMSIGTSNELIAVINSAKNREVIEVKCAAKIKTIYINEKPELVEWRIPEGYEATTDEYWVNMWKKKGCEVIRTEKHYGKTWYLFDKACVLKKIEKPFCEAKIERPYFFYKHEETALIEERRKKDAGYYIACKDKSGVYMKEFQKGAIVKGEYYKVKVSYGIIGREYKETHTFFIGGVRNKVEPHQTSIKVGETWQDIVGWLPNWTKKKFYRTLPYSEIIDAAIDQMKDKIIVKVGAKKEAKPTIFVNVETKETHIYEYNPWVVPPVMIYETEPAPPYELPPYIPPTPPIVDTKCFIATAAYGTPFAKEIDILRAFRDNSLEPKLIGKKFINTYYKISPPIANFISRREKLRAITRFMLNPIVKAFKRGK